MSKKNKVIVTATLDSRCRAGLCFGKAPTTAEVDDKQLAALQADKYLSVEIVEGNQLPPADEDNAAQAQALADALAAEGHTQADKPLPVDKCKKLVEFKVSADIRDAAWALLPTEKQPDDKSKDGE